MARCCHSPRSRRPTAAPAADAAAAWRHPGGHGAIDRGQLAEALEEQQQQDQRIGRILVANRLICEDDLDGSAFARSPGSASSISRRARSIASWPAASIPTAASSSRRCPGGRSAAPGSSRSAIRRTPRRRWRPAAAPRPGSRWRSPRPADVRRAIVEVFAGRLRDDARTRCPEAFSCRGWTAGAEPLAHGPRSGWPEPSALRRRRWLALQLVVAWVLLANAMTMGLRLVAIFARLRAAAGRRPPATRCGSPTTRSCRGYRSWCRSCARRRWRSGSCEALGAMDYPAPLLDIKLVLEADDAITRAAIDRADAAADDRGRHRARRRA